jgi:hypothetical protein
MASYSTKRSSEPYPYGVWPLVFMLVMLGVPLAGAVVAVIVDAV